MRRESIRLTQIQDIAGCRLTVPDIATQDSVVQSLKTLFGHKVVIIDRRQQPSHGYRAVHVVVGFRGKLLEIQVRTELQHLWAELSEKLSDIWDPAIKYGKGEESLQQPLATLSTIVDTEELMETQLAELVREMSSLNNLPEDLGKRFEKLRQEAIEHKQLLLKNLSDAIEDAEKFRGDK